MALEVHAHGISGAIQLAVAPVFMRRDLEAKLPHMVSALFICLLIAGAFLGAFVATDLTRTIGAMFALAVSTPRHIPR